MSFDWIQHTRPFTDPDDHEPAQFVLHQVNDRLFQLPVGFQYHQPDGGVIEVDSKTLVDTDLASIPLFMAWFVPVNGRHTPAALVHDRLVAASRQPGSAPDARADADDIFVVAMGEIEVAILRRHLMYAAVTSASRFTRGGIRRLGMIAWGLASLAGTVALLWALWNHVWLVAVAAALAPIAGAALWGKRNFWEGLLAGYAVWVVAVPALASLVGYSIYWVFEQLVRFIVSRGEQEFHETPAPPPLR